MRRVVITGLGVVSPIGNSVAEFWESIKAGRHGFELVEWFPGKSEEKNVAAFVKNFDPLKYFDKKDLRRTDKIAQYAVAAALEALGNAGTKFEDIDPFRRGVIIGSGIGGYETTQLAVKTYYEKGQDRVSPFTIPMMIGNLAAGLVAIRTQFKGVNYCPVSACASSTHALGEAFRSIKHGYSDVVLAGGTEMTAQGSAFAAFNNMHAITRSKDVDRASIPFDKERGGFVMGHGSGVLVLEELEHAKARGAKIYAEFVGYGATCDAYHETSPAPDGNGGAMSMKLAVEESGLPLSSINYINAHGTSTSMNDRTETAAIKSCFGEDSARKIAVNSTKSMTGHLLGAAGAIEAAVTALQIQESVVHATLGYKEPDPDCDLDYVTDGLRKLKITGAVSNSLGFGGHNASICIAPYNS